MDNLPTVFERYAKSFLEKHWGIVAEWEDMRRGRKRLKILRQDDDGFDVVVEAEIYGLYPFAGDWHGAPWEAEATDQTSEKLCEQFMGFVRSLLCADSRLEVKYAGSKPFKWVLTFPTESGSESETTALILFNYFAKRGTRVFQNHHLPQRHN